MATQLTVSRRTYSHAPKWLLHPGFIPDCCRLLSCLALLHQWPSLKTNTSKCLSSKSFFISSKVEDTALWRTGNVMSLCCRYWGEGGERGTMGVHYFFFPKPVFHLRRWKGACFLLWAPAKPTALSLKPLLGFFGFPVATAFLHCWITPNIIGVWHTQ